ncbi:hypothetical protein VRRI112168_20210 [Vreelandella rituensis]
MPWIYTRTRTITVGFYKSIFTVAIHEFGGRTC